MKITQVETIRFKTITNTERDSDGHGHPGPERETTQTLLQIGTDEGVSGYWFGANAQAIDSIVKPAIVGEDPFYREKIWRDLNHRQRLNLGTLSDQVLMAVDLALWDLAGRALEQPVYKLLGGLRDKVPAYASTMCGDDLKGGLATPEDYANYAQWCMERGYPAFKLHTWQPPYAGAPDPKRDIEACAAVREAVGPDVPCMLDPYHYYDREAALFLAKELEKLDYYWMEEPMDEHSMSSYVWLCEQTSLPICGPETCEGKMYVRAEWIKAGACDISRCGVGDVGGLTPLDENRASVRVVWHALRNPRRRPRQPARPVRHAQRRILRTRPVAPLHRLRPARPVAARARRANGRAGFCPRAPTARIGNEYQLGLHREE